MEETAKYLIRAAIETSGIVERNDVVGAVSGQTEGLLGEDLEIRDLQDSSKVGRIDVEIDSDHGRSHGELRIATSLDKVETAILAAALETIDRVGPCRSTIEIRAIEDVRAARRRAVVDRAKRLLTDSFDGSVMSSADLVEEVRSSVRVADISKFEGLPAGPRVGDSDAIIVVEGRADVRQLLEFGIKNAIAVEGTDVPVGVAELTAERTVTAFLDGDRGGDLILRELAQVGDIDHVALAPRGSSVENLDRAEVMAALREKHEATAALAAMEDTNQDLQAVLTEPETADPGSTSGDAENEAVDRQANGVDENGESASTEADSPEEPSDGTLGSLAGQVRAVRDAGSVRLVAADFTTLEEGPVESAFDLLRSADPVPAFVVLDGTLEQRLLDVCSQRGVEQLVVRATGEFVKQPTSVRLRTFEALLEPPDPANA